MHQVIRVHTSNSLGELVAALADGLPRPGAGGHDAIFDSPWLLVPGRPMETFVDLELARRRNISGNLDTLTLRGAVARLCAGAEPAVALIEREHILGELLAIFDEEDGSEDDGDGDGDGGGGGGEDEWSAVAPATATASSSSVLQPFRRYFRAATNALPARERRRLQLASALAGLFDDWSQSRPELLTVWRSGRLVSEGEAARLEAAERALWLRLFAAGGRFERRGAAEGRRFLTLDDLVPRGVTETWRPPSHIHLFGLAEIPRAYFPILERLGQRTAVSLYTLNPCREFWEDLDTARGARLRATQPSAAPATRRRRAGRPAVDSRQLELAALRTAPAPAPAAAASLGRSEMADEDGLPAATSNPLLTLWGRATRDHLRLLGQLTDGDFEARFVDRSANGSDGGTSERAGGDDGGLAPSLLSKLQRDVLAGQASHWPSSPGLDDSIRIIGAPEPRREWETIAAEIWALMRADPTLRFADIAVLIAGQDRTGQAAFPLVSTVFHEAGGLPWTWADPTIATSSHLGESFLQVMELFQSRFTRREVLDVITHPNVKGRYPDASAEVWVELCDALGVAQGTDRTAFAHTYVTADVFNWDQALRRLALGMFAAGPRGGFEAPLVWADRPEGNRTPTPRTSDVSVGPSEPVASLVPAELPEALRADADSLGLLVRSLIGDADFARHARMTLGEWVDFARGVLDSYTCALSPDDEAARIRILGTLDELATRFGAAVRLPLPLAVSLMRDTVSSLRGGRAQLLGAGVVVGTLRTLRSLPFRVVFVAGLDGSAFPARESRSVFDPQGPSRLAARAESPVGPTVRERDQQLFLEAVLAASDALILTYVDRDALTGEPLLPSSAITQLEDVLRENYLEAPARRGRVSTTIDEQSPASPMTLRRSVPLHRDEDPTSRAAFPAATAEAAAREVGAAIRRDIPEAARLPGDALTRALAAETRATLAPLLSTLESLGPPSPPPMMLGAAPRRPIVVRLSELVRFLQCPLQGSARFLLRLRDIEDDADARDLEDEPLAASRRTSTPLLTESFLAAWQRQHPVSVTDLEAAYDDVARQQRFSSRAPTGRFLDHVRTGHLECLSTWREQLSDPAIGIVGAPGRIAFGRPEHRLPVAATRPAIRLALASTAALAASPILAGRPDSPELSIELHGTTAALVPLREGLGAWLLPSQRVADEQTFARQRVEAFLYSVAMIVSTPAATAEPNATDGPRADCPPLFSLHPCRDGRSARKTPAVAPGFGGREARAYLTTLVSDLLTGVSTIFFPCEAVFQALKSRLPLREQLAFMRGDPYYRRRLSTGWGPVPDPFEYPIPDGEALRELRRRRFDGLLGGAAAGPGAANEPFAPGAGAEEEGLA